MPRNGSGAYSLPSGNPVVTGTTVSSTTMNNTLTDVGNALTGSLSADGQTPLTGNLNVNGFRLTGAGAASALTDYVTATEVQKATWSYLTTVAGTNTVTASAPGLAAYTAGQVFRFIAAGKNTGAATLNINALGAKAITKFGASALVDGDIQPGAVVTVSYDGTQFQLEGVATQGSLAGGWQKLQNGFIEQWTGNVTTSATNDVGWTFPIAFPTGCAGVFPTYVNGGGSAAVVVSVGAVSASGANIGAYITTTGARTTAATYIRAIGY